MRISDWSSDVCSSDLCFDQPISRCLRRSNCAFQLCMGCAVVLEFCETRFHMEHYRGCAARRCLGKGCDAPWTTFRGSVLSREYLFAGFPDALKRRDRGFLTFLRLLSYRSDVFLRPLIQFETTSVHTRLVSELF